VSESPPRLVPEGIDPGKVRILLISEALPEDEKDYFYSSSDSLYVTNTIGAFKNAGIDVDSIEDIVRKGALMTVAVKQPRVGLTVPADTIKRHSYQLEEEINQYPNIKAILLMGDAAIRAMNFISQRNTKRRVVPSGSTYKIRKGEFFYRDIRIFPSYLQTGKNFLIEKSKRIMVAEDIGNAFSLL